MAVVTTWNFTLTITRQTLRLPDPVDGGAGTDECLAIIIQLSPSTFTAPCLIMRSALEVVATRSAGPLSRLAMASPSPFQGQPRPPASSSGTFLEKRWVEVRGRLPGRRLAGIAGDDLWPARSSRRGFRVPAAMPALNSSDFSQRTEGEQLAVVPHQIVGDGHDLAEHLTRGVVYADVVGGGLGHLLDAVQAHQSGIISTHWVAMPASFAARGPSAG